MQREKMQKERGWQSHSRGARGRALGARGVALRYAGPRRNAIKISRLRQAKWIRGAQLHASHVLLCVLCVSAVNAFRG